MRAFTASLLLSLLPTYCLAADAVALPYIGTFLGADGTLIDIQGVPGASRLTPNPDTTPYARFECAAHAPLRVAARGSDLVIPATGRHISFTEPVVSLALSPNGTYIAATTSSALHILSLGEDSTETIRLASFGIADGAVTVAVSDFGDALIATDTAVFVFGIARPSPVFAPLHLTIPRFQPASAALVAFAPDAHTLVSLRADALVPQTLLEDLAQPTTLEFANPTTIWVGQPTALLKYSLETGLTTPYTFASPQPLRSIGVPGLYLSSDAALFETRRDTPQFLFIAKQSLQ